MGLAKNNKIQEFPRCTCCKERQLTKTDKLRMHPGRRKEGIYLRINIIVLHLIFEKKEFIIFFSLISLTSLEETFQMYYSKGQYSGHYSIHYREQTKIRTCVSKWW